METTPQQPAPGTGAGSSGNFMKDMENFFDTYLHKKVPFHIPPAGKEFIVKYGPWITLALLVLTALVLVPLALLVFGLSAVTQAPYGYGVIAVHYSPLYDLSVILGIASLVMEGLAIPGLLKRSLTGWRMVYYAALVSAVGNLVVFSWVNLIVGLAISMYFLFQIKEYYK